MKDVELDEIKFKKLFTKNEGGFYKLLEKICKDFNVKDSKRTIKNFIEKQ